MLAVKQIVPQRGGNVLRDVLMLTNSLDLLRREVAKTDAIVERNHGTSPDPCRCPSPCSAAGTTTFIGLRTILIPADRKPVDSNVICVVARVEAAGVVVGTSIEI